ncbi:MAG TPA: TetR/AcrR family transcriptional regulator [Polyangium sp.]|nr:TetR/AcrR family transcriptional regulator [Polyangium sp.]
MPRATKSDRRRPEQERSKQTVEDILNAATLVLKQVGIAQTTTDRIAERAGLSVGSLYQYFPNKIALYEALMRRHFEHVTNIALAHAQRLHDASAEEFPALVAQLVLTQERKDPHLSALLHQIAAMHETVGSIEIEHSRLLERSLATLLREKSTTPGFRTDVDPDIASRILTRALTGILRRTMQIDPSFIESDVLDGELQRLIHAYVLAPVAQT